MVGMADSGRDRRGVDPWSGADALTVVRLPGLQEDQAAEHVQRIEEAGRVLGQPVIGLNLAQGRRWLAVADDRALAVLAAVAEPPLPHVLGRDLAG